MPRYLSLFMEIESPGFLVTSQRACVGNWPTLDRALSACRNECEGAWRKKWPNVKYRKAGRNEECFITPQSVCLPACFLSACFLAPCLPACFLSACLVVCFSPHINPPDHLSINSFGHSKTVRRLTTVFEPYTYQQIHMTGSALLSSRRYSTSFPPEPTS